MSIAFARRVTAGALIGFMALVLPAVPSFADMVVTDTKVTAAPDPGPMPTPKLTKDEALARLKQYFPVPQESATVSVEASLATRGTRTTWEFMVNVRQGNGSMGSGLGSVDATTGRILSYTGANFPGAPIQIGPAGPARPEAEAREKAWKLVAEMYPEFAPNLKPLDPKDQSPLYGYYYGSGYGVFDGYSFTWTMEVDGIPFPYGSISVSLDKATLAFTNLTANLPEAMSFPPGPAKIDAKAAMDAWSLAGDPQLSYVAIAPKSIFGMYKPTGYYLAYLFRAPGQPVDAMTGKLVVNPMDLSRPTFKPEPVPAGDMKPLLPGATPLTDEEGYKRVLELFGITDTSLVHAQPDMGYMDEEQLQYWVSDREFSANVAFNKATGMIRYASRSANMPQPVPQGGGDKVSPEQEAQARAAAIAVVQKYYSPYREELRIAAGSDPYWSSDNSMRHFTFMRYVNGVPVNTDNIGVTIDLNTMQWRDFSCNWTTGVTFPSPEHVISPAEAAIKFYAGKQPRLIYQPVYPAVVPGPYSTPAPTKAQLVYVLESRPDASMVNALTGELTGYDGQPISAMAEAVQKVQGHWAGGALRYLLTRQALDLDKLNPDAPVTRLQAVQMLLQREPMPYGRDMRPATLPFADVKQSDAGYNTVLAAYREGWLPSADTFRPQEQVTRAEFAVWAVSALGYGDLARSPLSVTPVYSDMKGLTGEEVNAIHFLHSLGIVGAGERFRPADVLTQAEGAVITARIYNYLLAKRVE